MCEARTIDGVLSFNKLLLYRELRQKILQFFSYKSGEIVDRYSLYNR